MQILAYDDDFLPRVSYEEKKQRRGRHRRASSCCGLRISPPLRINGLSKNRFSYDTLPQHPLRLTICKLDGSSFDIEVVKTATVGELKQAVEGVFKNIPRKGPGKISWSHVWGNFCLCYDGWKLLADSESIRSYMINDGDQLYFVRHASMNKNLIRTLPKEKLLTLDQPRMSSGNSNGCLEKEKNGEKDDSSDDQGNSPSQYYSGGNKDLMRPYEFKFAQILGSWFSYRRL